MMPWFVLLLVALGVLSVVVQAASKEWESPVTWGQAISHASKGMSGTMLLMLAMTTAMLFLVSQVMTSVEEAHADVVEFETGMTQALERVAYMRDGGADGFREWSGHASDGSRYAILRDEAGAVVRVENLSRASCDRVVGTLSPYASSTLAMRDERGVRPLADRQGICPEGEARLQAVFRAPR